MLSLIYILLRMGFYAGLLYVARTVDDPIVYGALVVCLTFSMFKKMLFYGFLIFVASLIHLIPFDLIKI